MNRFAQIDGVLVTAVLEAATAPAVLPDGRSFVDITDRPSVRGGDTYDVGTDTFTASAVEARAVFPQPADVKMDAILAELKALRRGKESDDAGG